ncbi:hypothetical protein GEMRC1_005578 [Eukaryota sp. GEM-RC1]
MSDSETEAIDVGTYEGSRNESGHRHGYGECTYSTGDSYKGNYINGLKSGQGKYIWSHPTHSYYYEGNYQDGVRNGLGKLTFPDGSSYDGEFNNGTPHGQGTMTYVSGDSYTGEFANGARQGKGEYRFALTSEILRGQWEDGFIVEGERWISDDFFWKGSFKKGQPFGEGFFEFVKLGYRQHGSYVLTAAEVEDVKEENSDDEEESLDKVVKVVPPSVLFIPGRIENI